MRCNRRSVVPAPPDAPQPKGQLLDFIEALKKRRAALRRQGRAGQEGARWPPRDRPGRRRQAGGHRAPPPPQPASAKLGLRAHRTRSTHQVGIGYGPSPARERARGEGKNGPRQRQRARKSPSRRLRCYRRAPRPRRAGRSELPSRRWRSLCFQAADRARHRRPRRRLSGPAAAIRGPRRQRGLEPGRPISRRPAPHPATRAR